MAIKNIVFDLGGVILNLDFEKSAQAFTALGIKNFNEYFTQLHANPLFKQLETGAIINAGFYDELRTTTGITAGNKEIDAAWNAMLLDFPVERIEKLKELSTHYRLFLFSNTNAIHHTAFHKNFQQLFHFNFDTIFEKAWYSHLIGHRKPDGSAFEYIIRDGSLAASETLFIDDTLPNVQAAIKAGLQAAHISPGKDMLMVLPEVL